MTKSRILLIAIFLNCIPLVMCTLCQSASGEAKPKLEDSTLKELVRADQELGNRLPGLQELKKVSDEADRLQSYTVKIRIWTFKKSGTRLDGGLFHYLKPDLVKVKVTEGKRKGSTVVRRKDGTIRGHMNNALKIFARTLKPDSKRLYATNGYHLLNSDLASLVSKAVKNAKGPGTVLKTDKVISIEMVNSSSNIETVKTRVIDLYHSGDRKDLRTRIYLDPHTDLPVQWCDYKNNEPCFITRFIDLDRDKELTCENFDLGFRIPVP